MYPKKICHLLCVSGLFLLLNSCTAGQLNVSSVRYQSIRTSFAQPKTVPDNASLAAQFFINSKGKLLVVVYNRSDKILTVDQTKSFFVNTDGTSTSYFDPTVYSSTSGGFNSDTKGSSINLGVISDILGVGGITSSLLGGINVNSSSTTGTFNHSTVQVQDVPQISIAPHGKMVMSKEFVIKGVGNNVNANNYVDAKYGEAPLKFNVCITYNFDDEQQEKFITDFYVNSNIVELVNKGKVSDAFAAIYNQKPDAVAEYTYMFEIMTNLPRRSVYSDYETFVSIDNNYSELVRGSLINYK